MQHAPLVLLTEIIFKLLLDYSLYFPFSREKHMFYNGTSRSVQEYKWLP